MEETISMQIIAHIRTDFGEKFGVPRQSGLVPALEGEIVFTPDFRSPDCLRGIEDYSHLWLLWQFHRAETWSPTVRPPRLGGNTRMGVFATRSPFRPNHIGLSSVALLGVEQTRDRGPVLRVAGADLMDGTPILDIKPFLPYTDNHPEATGGFTDTLAPRALRVEISPALLDRVAPNRREALLGVLAGDPRPSYQSDPDRVYGMDFGGQQIRFTVAGNCLTVVDIA